MSSNDEEGKVRVAGLTTFNPDLDRLDSNLNAITGQFDHIYVWDNGSENYCDILKRCQKYADVVSVETNGRNIGVASALNVLVRRGADAGAEWILLLDQDSMPPEGLYDGLSEHADSDIAIISPRISDINRNEHEVECQDVQEYMWPITSGSLINIKIWQLLGGFDERLFIDFVDDEYSIRVFLAGYRSIRVNSIILHHEIGHLKPVGIPFPHCENGDIVWRRAYSSGHSAMRHYYQVRNLTYLRKHYGKELEKKNITLPSVNKFIVHSLIFEPNKWENLIAMCKGKRDSKELVEADEQ